MMRKAVWGCLLTVLLLLQGCAFLHSLDANLEQKVDAWVADKEFARALAALDYVRPSHKDFAALQRKKQDIQVAAKRYEEESIRLAHGFMDQQQWHEAEKVFSTALQKLPQSETLNIAWQNFQALRAQYLQAINYQLIINKAEQLIKDKPLQADLQRAIPDDQAQQKLHTRFVQEVNRVRHALLDCGLHAMQANELAQAERCFVLANELSPHVELQQTIQEIQQQLGQPTEKKIAVLSDKAHAELALAREALDQGNLQLAKQHYQDIPDKDKRHALTKTFAEALQQRIDSNVKQGIEVGRKLYSQGEIERALAVWNKLRQLDPQNEYLLSHIERAERVMKKIQELRRLNQPDTTQENKPAQ